MNCHIDLNSNPCKTTVLSDNVQEDLYLIGLTLILKAQSFI